MIFTRLALTAAPLLVVASLVKSPTCYACGRSACGSDQFLPRAGTVPANLAAIAWEPGYDQREGAADSGARSPVLECTAADGTTHAVRFVALPEDKPDYLQLSEPLIAGEHCTLHSGISDCSLEDATYAEASYLTGQAEFDVTAESSMPEQLGLIAVTGARVSAVNVAANASCSENIEVCGVEASLEWNSAALPWKDALIFETFVDGERYSTSRNLSVPNELGGLYFGREHDVVFATLGDIPDNVQLSKELEPGEHSLEIRAHLPGSTQILSTPPVTIVLSCGHNPQPPVAAAMIDSGSDGCTVASSLGSSGRRSSALVSIMLGALGLLLVAARRGRR